MNGWQIWIVGGSADFPVPSTGRGIEGEGWFCALRSLRFPGLSNFLIPHHGPRPVEERGRTESSRRRIVSLLFVLALSLTARAADLMPVPALGLRVERGFSVT